MLASNVVGQEELIVLWLSFLRRQTINSRLFLLNEIERESVNNDLNTILFIFQMQL